MAAGALALAVTAAAGPADGVGQPPPLRLADDPSIDPSDFRVTTFAWGLPYPTSMVELSDGSLLVAINVATQGGFIDGTGKLLRLVDVDADGVADRQEPVGVLARSGDAGTLIFTDVPGAIVQMKRLDDLLFLVSREPSRSSVSVFRAPELVGDPYLLLDTLTMDYALAHVHDTYALAVRPGADPDTVDLLFNVGSRFNARSDPRPVRASGMLETSLQPESIWRITLRAGEDALEVVEAELVATGLRNAAGLEFQPDSGDLYLLDNGIDLPDDPDEPLSADELNVIASRRLGVDVMDFGFPDAYVEYRTGSQVGTGGQPPLVTFQPIDGSEAEGAAGLAFAPDRFPEGLSDGLFVGFHGRFLSGGLANEENPLLYVDPPTGAYHEFIANDVPSVGHLDNLLATGDSLFIADLGISGNLTGAGNEGVIYQVRSIEEGTEPR